MTDEARALLFRGRSAKRHEHRWLMVNCAVLHLDQDGRPAPCPTPLDRCGTCGLLKADYEARQRRGRNNRSRGNRSELDVARTYGGEKVGPLGLPEDIRGTQWRTQVKVRQSAPPKMWTDEFRKLDGQRDGRSTRLILRFVRQGIGSEDFIVIRGKDWLEHWGKDE